MGDIGFRRGGAQADPCGADGGRRNIPANAAYFTEAILDTELSGLSGHGFYWLQYYCEHVKSGKVNGKAKPRSRRSRPWPSASTPTGGFAHPAIEAGFAKLVPAAKKYGIAGWRSTIPTMRQRWAFTPARWRGRGSGLRLHQSCRPLRPWAAIDTGDRHQSMSFAVPGKKGKVAFLIDQSSSAVAWTAVKRASEEGKDHSAGLGAGQAGKADDDAMKGLEGSMAQSGGYKGFGQGLIVEVMCAALAGALRGAEMGSFVEMTGGPIGCGSSSSRWSRRCSLRGLRQTGGRAGKVHSSSKKVRGFPISRREANIKRQKKEGLLIDSAPPRTAERLRLSF